MNSAVSLRAETLLGIGGVRGMSRVNSIERMMSLKSILLLSWSCISKNFHHV